MDSSATVAIDASRFPGRARAAYLESFRSRRMNHQFHYDTEKQARLWLAIHEAFSPARTDEKCLEIYQIAFAETARLIPFDALVSLGCGGGQKDLALLEVSKCRAYAPTDVSPALALTAHLAARAQGIDSRPGVLDLATITDLRGFLAKLVPTGSRNLFAFFGMLPNFEPADGLGKFAAAMATGEHVLLSANLAPGPAYRAGVERVLPQYDNAPTRRWLSTVLVDAGLEANADELDFEIKEVPGSPALLRIEVSYRFRARREIRMDGETFAYKAGETFRLFFSYRHTPQTLAALLRNFDLNLVQEWIAPSGEEGVFLCRKGAI
jgi:uncharacterized SAM-dependent methyltransferase